MSEQVITPKLGDIQPVGYTCVREVGTVFGERVCGRPANIHLKWDEAGENSLACENHAEEALTAFDIYDCHRMDAACGTPGSIWVASGTRGDSFCGMDEHPELVAMQALDLTDSV